MYTLVQTIPIRRLALEQIPVLVTSFVIAEVFFKFKSFSLECLAFLATWFILDLFVQYVIIRKSRSNIVIYNLLRIIFQKEKNE